MIKKIQRRFIFFCVFVISVIVGLIELIVLCNTQADISHHRSFMVGLIILILVMIGSILISKIAVKPIQQAWQRQIEFTADASHELRTPIAVIRSSGEIMLENSKETIESQMQWLENILYENKRMEKLVENLLLLSRADGREVELNKNMIPLGILIDGRIEAMKTLAQEKGITLEREGKEELEIYGDEQRLSQLITILLDNAIKYMNRPGKVIVRTQNKGKKVLLSVADNGEGMEEADRKHIFQRFYRADKSRGNKQEGYGLGLSIAKWIVESHNGNIWVESKKGVGTTFYIELML